MRGHRLSYDLNKKIVIHFTLIIRSDKSSILGRKCDLFIRLDPQFVLDNERSKTFHSFQDIVEQMQKIGHRVNMIAPTSFAAVTSIYRDKDTIFGSCDKKRPGQVDGF